MQKFAFIFAAFFALCGGGAGAASLHVNGSDWAATAAASLTDIPENSLRLMDNAGQLYYLQATLLTNNSLCPLTLMRDESCTAFGGLLNQGCDCGWDKCILTNSATGALYCSESLPDWTIATPETCAAAYGEQTCGHSIEFGEEITYGPGGGIAPANSLRLQTAEDLTFFITLPEPPEICNNANFEFGEPGECIWCGDDLYSWNGTECLLCGANEIANPAHTACVCAPGTFGEPRNCKCRGDWNRNWNDETLSCDCNDGYFSANGQECTWCGDANMYWDHGTCTTCGENMVVGATGASCECARGFVMDEFGACVPDENTGGETSCNSPNMVLSAIYPGITTCDDTGIANFGNYNTADIGRECYCTGGTDMYQLEDGTLKCCGNWDADCIGELTMCTMGLVQTPIPINPPAE